jgi:Rhs element Vgr protein
VSVVTVTILNTGLGKKLDEVHPLVSVGIWREVNRIPHASLVLVDGDAAERQFALSDSAFFAPGAEIEIKLRFEGVSQDATVFRGLVIRHGVEANLRGSLLHVDLKDSAVRLTQGRRSRVFRDQSDAELIAKLVSEAGLKKGVVAATPTKHAEIVQYQCTDWDFMLTRAEANGLLALVLDGEVSLRAVDLAAAPKRRCDVGISDLHALEVDLDASGQMAKLSGQSWDPGAHKLGAALQAKAFALKQGNGDAAQIAAAMGFADQLLTHPVALAPKELQAWADAGLVRSRLSMLRGRVSVPGDPALALLDVIEIDGVGRRFNGKTLVTGLCHRVDVDGWRTDVQFGLSPRSFSQEQGIQAAPAAGLLPGIGALHLGVIAKFEADPDKQFRVKVVLPGVGAENDAVWARLAAPEAGKERGYFFRPEPGDEVVVGFFNQDPRQPVILGALYSAKSPPPQGCTPLAEDNLAKGFVTRRGTKILFNDADKASLRLETASKNLIVLDDDQQSICITDQHGNTITLDKNGITLDSAKDLVLSAKGQVEIKGQKVDVK